MPGNSLKLYFGTENGKFLRNKISRCLLTICNDDKFQKLDSLKPAHHHCVFYHYGTNQCAEYNTDMLCHCVAQICLPLKYHLQT